MRNADTCFFIQNGDIVPPPPPGWFHCATRFDIMGSIFLVNGDLLRGFNPNCVVSLRFEKCHVDMDGIDFSGLHCLEILAVVDCGIGASKGDFILPGSVRHVCLPFNGISDMSFLKFNAPATAVELTIDLSDNDVEDISTLDLRMCDHATMLHFRDNKIKTVGSWIPPKQAQFVGFGYNQLTVIPGYMYTESVKWTDLSGNGITDISDILNVRLYSNLGGMIFFMGLRDCPLEPASKALASMWESTNYAVEKCRIMATIVALTMLVHCDRRVPVELYMTLRPYLY